MSKSRKKTDTYRPALDHDHDGRNGGSLPGRPAEAVNRQAEEIKEAAQVDLEEAIQAAPPVEPEPEPVEITFESLQAASALADMARHRYGLYRTVNGYCSDASGRGAVHPDGVVLKLVEMGLAFDEPTGGRMGSVKINAIGRALLPDAMKLLAGAGE